MNQIDEVKNIADGMISIGGIPNNDEFYAEFNFRLQSKLGIKNKCEWKCIDIGMYGCSCYIWKTSCGTDYDADKTPKYKYCPNCGCAVS